MERLLTATLAVALATCSLLLPASAAAAGAVTIHVAPKGHDAAAGTAAAPLRTLGAALRRATGGQRVQLAPGTYGYARDEMARTTDVEVVGAGTAKTTVNGLQIYGGQRLRFSGIRFTGPVVVQGHPIRHATQPATSVRLSGNELTATNTFCVSIREGSRDITVSGNRIHGCTSGILGQGNPYVSRGITIEGNRIERIKGDAIQFGAWSQVRIASNTIRDIVDPAGAIHNDGIQLTGNSTDVEISRNRIHNSRSQLMLIQDAIGPIDRIDVTANLMIGAGAVGLQVQGATNALIRSNTIWGAKDGGLWVRGGYVRNGASVVPSDTVVTNNLATTMRFMEGASASTAAGNVVLCPGKYSGLTVPPGAACVADPGFANAAAGQYWLTLESPTRGLGTRLWLPATGLTDAPYPRPLPGAYH